jgi:hypothetical protein
LGSSPYANLDQLCERQGLDACHPYFHRGVFELGFRTPPRFLNGGEHPKHALRATARLALQGGEPPWPAHKVVFDDTVSADFALITALGPPMGWHLVDAEILDARHAAMLAERAVARAPIRPFDSTLAIAERYLRRYG